MHRKISMHGVCHVLLLFVALGTANPAMAASWLDRLKDIVSSRESSGIAPTSEEIGEGIKEALRVGTENVVSSLGKTDGFNLDPQVHIPLPGDLTRAKDLLAKVGMESLLADLELRLNRAAELATPGARHIFVDTIQTMTFDDVMSIYHGPQDAATQYFRSRMSAPLADEMRPIVDDALAEAGAVKAYGATIERYNAIPFAPEVDADLTRYVVDKSIDGIFYYLAAEEAAIRQDPAKRTTGLLKRVFGSTD